MSGDLAPCFRPTAEARASRRSRVRQLSASGRADWKPLDSRNQAKRVDTCCLCLPAGLSAEALAKEEAIGLPVTFRAAVEEVAFTGRVVYIGYAKDRVDYETRLFVQKELDIMGSRNAEAADFDEVIAMLRSGKYPVDETITRVVPFDQAGEALKDWDANPPAFTKILVELP